MLRPGELWRCVILHVKVGNYNTGFGRNTLFHVDIISSLKSFRALGWIGLTSARDDVMIYIPAPPTATIKPSKSPASVGQAPRNAITPILMHAHLASTFKKSKH